MIAHSLPGPYFSCSTAKSSHPGLLLFFRCMVVLFTSVYVKGCCISIGGMSVIGLILYLLKKSSMTLDIILISFLLLAVLPSVLFISRGFF